MKPRLRQLDVTELRNCVMQLAAELDMQVRAGNRTSGLITAQIVAATLAGAFVDGEFQFTPEAFGALAELDYRFQRSRFLPEADRARELFRRIRDPLAHFDSSLARAASDEAHGMSSFEVKQAIPSMPSRRTRCTTDLALRLLFPEHRQRYREEWSAELAELPRRDQASYAFRLLSRSWSLRRELSEKPSQAPTVGLAVMVAVPGVDAVAALCGIDWPAAIVAIGWTVCLAWVLGSRDRTEHLVSLIREMRSAKKPESEDPR